MINKEINDNVKDLDLNMLHVLEHLKQAYCLLNETEEKDINFNEEEKKAIRDIKNKIKNLERQLFKINLIEKERINPVLKEDYFDDLLIK